MNEFLDGDFESKLYRLPRQIRFVSGRTATDYNPYGCNHPGFGTRPMW
jgi:hypothetical protein